MFVSVSLFLIVWLVGSAVYMKLEGWCVSFFLREDGRGQLMVARFAGRSLLRFISASSRSPRS